MSVNISLQIHEPDSLELDVNELNSLELDVNEQISMYGNSDYEKLRNLPQINTVELRGNKTFDDLGMSALTNMEIYELLQ